MVGTATDGELAPSYDQRYQVQIEQPLRVSETMDFLSILPGTVVIDALFSLLQNETLSSRKIIDLLSAPYVQERKDAKNIRYTGRVLKENILSKSVYESDRFKDIRPLIRDILNGNKPTQSFGRDTQGVVEQDDRFDDIYISPQEVFYFVLCSKTIDSQEKIYLQKNIIEFIGKRMATISHIHQVERAYDLAEKSDFSLYSSDTRALLTFLCRRNEQSFVDHIQFFSDHGDIFDSESEQQGGFILKERIRNRIHVNARVRFTEKQKTHLTHEEQRAIEFKMASRVERQVRDQLQRFHPFSFAEFETDLVGYSSKRATFLQRMKMKFSFSIEEISTLFAQQYDSMRMRLFGDLFDAFWSELRSGLIKDLYVKKTFAPSLEYIEKPFTETFREDLLTEFDISSLQKEKIIHHKHRDRLLQAGGEVIAFDSSQYDYAHLTVNDYFWNRYVREYLDGISLDKRR